LDLGDKVSRVCEVNAAGEVVKRASVGTNPTMIDVYFAGRARSRVILEVGTHSPWISRRIEALGHQVVVANPSAVYGKRRRKKAQ
jgi:transposase